MAKEIENNDQDYKIWFPYEIFYIESMLTVARTAMDAQTQLQMIIEELEKGKPNTKEDTDDVIDLVQTILIGAASLSRYFWAVRSGIIHQKRAERLREAFAITEENPLKNRDVRNFMEHFDEKLDIFLSQNVAGTFIPSSVGRRTNDDQGTYHFFRAFHTDDWTFEVLKVEVKIIPIIAEIIRIFLLLMKFRDEGGRLPRSINE